MSAGKTEKKEKKKLAPAVKAGKNLKKGKARNYDLGCGVYRFSRSRMYHKKALYKFVGKKTAKAEKPKKMPTVVKEIRGEKNGGKRTVFLKKRTKSFPTANRIRRHPMKKCFAQHKRRIRGSLKPGAVLILLAGCHKGRRVVLLKTLPTGLLLVTGPFSVNSVPLRRVHPNYVIATATQIDISSVKLPDGINDKYFKRVKQTKAKKDDGDIFAAKKEPYKPSEQRKTDQKLVDKQVLAAIKKQPERKMLYRYLSAMFGLKSSQYPHRMKF